MQTVYSFLLEQRFQCISEPFFRSYRNSSTLSKSSLFLSLPALSLLFKVTVQLYQKKSAPTTFPPILSSYRMPLDFYLISSFTSLFQFWQSPRQRILLTWYLTGIIHLHFILLASYGLFKSIFNHRYTFTFPQTSYFSCTPQPFYFFKPCGYIFVPTFQKHKAQFRLREKAEVNLRITKTKGCI